MTQTKRCAYLTMANPGEFVMDYDLSYAPMRARGWQVEAVAWQDPDIDWNDFDAVYICTPWDYPDHIEQFMKVLQCVERSNAHLVNPLSLIEWTLAKTYLRDLEQRGAAIVPSLWFDDIDVDAIPAWFTAIGSDTLVIKPVVGVNATDAYVLRNPIADTFVTHLATTFAGRPFFVQPFVHNIQAEGEYSLFFFSGHYSHAILKTPTSGDFRVQEEHGAEIRIIEAPAALIDTAQRVLSLVDPEPVYVRADFVRGTDAQFWLMELELIEPSMYLRTDDGAAERFAAAFDAHIRGLEKT